MPKEFQINKILISFQFIYDKLKEYDVGYDVCRRMAELKHCVYVNSMTRVGPGCMSAATQMMRQAFWDMSSQYASLLPS